MTNDQNNVRIAANFLEEKGLLEPEFGLILGSGLGELAEEITDAIAIPMRKFLISLYQRLKATKANLYMET